MKKVSTSFPRVLSLYGVWKAPDDAFLWETLKIFRKNSSENPNDYWIARACGACLSTSSHCTAARYDPSTQYLSTSSPDYNSLVGGPWRLFVSPDPNHDKRDNAEMVLFSGFGLAALRDKKPHLFKYAWSDSHANKELMDYVSGAKAYELWGALRLIKECENEVFQDDPLPHGANWITAKAVLIDEAERERDNELEKETSGKLIADRSPLRSKESGMSSMFRSWYL